MAPISAPALAPTTRSIGTPARCSTRMTPTCAQPLMPPAPSTSAARGRPASGNAWPPGDAPNLRPDEQHRGDRRHGRRSMQVTNLEARLTDQADGVAVGVAAAAEPAPDRIDCVLRQRERGSIRADMLVEAELALRLEDALDLRQSLAGIADRAEDERADHGIEALVREGQLLGGRLYDLQRSGEVVGSLTGALQHVGIGLHELSDGRALVGEAEFGAAADLQHSPPGAAHYPPPHIREEVLLHTAA